MKARVPSAGNVLQVEPSWAFLWDIDGTLIDTTALIVQGLQHVYQTFLKRSLPFDTIRGIIGIPLAEQIRILGDPALYGADPAAMEREFIRWYEAHANQERIIPEAIQALKEGKRAGHPTAVVTSKNRAEIANTLPRLGIEAWVDVVVSAEDVEHPKPFPDPILAALKALCVPATHALYIGDTVHDAQAARAAGVLFCGVAWGAAGREALLSQNPDLFCEEPAELSVVLNLRLPQDRRGAGHHVHQKTLPGGNR